MVSRFIGRQVDRWTRLADEITKAERLAIFSSWVVAYINHHLFPIYNTCGERGNTENVICAYVLDVNTVNNMAILSR